MRFSLAESMVDPAQLTTLAIEAEQAGFSSFTVPDSLCYPRESDTEYPYYGDGSMHAGGDPADLDAHLARLAELRKEYGRENEPFELHVISLDGFTVDGARRLEDEGITDCSVGFRNAYEADTLPIEKEVAAFRGFGENVIAEV